MARNSFESIRSYPNPNPNPNPNAGSRMARWEAHTPRSQPRISARPVVSRRSPYTGRRNHENVHVRSAATGISLPLAGATPVRCSPSPGRFLSWRVPWRCRSRVPSSAPRRHVAVIVAMGPVRMMEMALDEIIRMAHVRYGLVATAVPVDVIPVVTGASVFRRADIRICLPGSELTFVDVPVVHPVQMAIVDIVDVAVVLQSRVAAGSAVGMIVFLVDLVGSQALSSSSRGITAAGRRTVATVALRGSSPWRARQTLHGTRSLRPAPLPLWMLAQESERGSERGTGTSRRL